MSRLWLLLPGLAACGAYGSAFSASESLALERCERAFACESAYPGDREVSFASLWGADAEACAAQIGPDPAFASAWKSAQKSGQIQYNKSSAKVCGDSLPLLTCDDFWAELEPESCASVVVGTVAKDQACAVDAVCASGLCDGGRCVGAPEED